MSLRFRIWKELAKVDNYGPDKMTLSREDIKIWATRGGGINRNYDVSCRGLMNVLIYMQGYSLYWTMSMLFDWEARPHLLNLSNWINMQMINAPYKFVHMGERPKCRPKRWNTLQIAISLRLLRVCFPTRATPPHAASGLGE